MKILPVIMSGGSGTWLWPMSTTERPKQLCTIGSQYSLLQETALRVKGADFLEPLMISGERYANDIRIQMEETGTEYSDLLLEPQGRSTAPVAVIASGWAKLKAPDAHILPMPADHSIADPSGFRGELEKAGAIPREYTTTFGMRPATPEIGYGYIEVGDLILDGVWTIRRFVEKPTRDIAEAHVKSGNFLWNSGILLFAAELLLEEVRRYCPDVATAASAAFALQTRSNDGWLLAPASMERCPSWSIDVAVMERTRRAAVVSCDFGWAGVCSWNALWTIGPHNADGNCVRGRTVAIDTRSSVLWSDGPSISAIGLSDLVIVATYDHVLVLSKLRSEEAKAIIERWKS